MTSNVLFQIECLSSSLYSMAISLIKALLVSVIVLINAIYTIYLHNRANATIAQFNLINHNFEDRVNFKNDFSIVHELMILMFALFLIPAIIELKSDVFSASIGGYMTININYHWTIIRNDRIINTQRSIYSDFNQMYYKIKIIILKISREIINIWYLFF